MSAKHGLSDDEAEVEAEEFDAKRLREEDAAPAVRVDSPEKPLLHHTVIKPRLHLSLDR